MTASSIAQYLEQRRTVRPVERAAAHKDPWAALTNRAAAAPGPREGETKPMTFASGRTLTRHIPQRWARHARTRLPRS